jgi:hypothetical protein
VAEFLYRVSLSLSADPIRRIYQSGDRLVVEAGGGGPLFGVCRSGGGKILNRALC